VSVAGDFNSWKNGDMLLSKDRNGVWSLTKKLKIDKTKQFYAYKFIIDDSKWVTNHKELKVWDEHGHENNKIIMYSSLGQQDEL
jgi:1,4-alpha-glucan branching enzyme